MTLNEGVRSYPMSWIVAIQRVKSAIMTTVALDRPSVERRGRGRVFEVTPIHRLLDLTRGPGERMAIKIV